MPNRKMIFLDIDGTLITEDDRHFLPESTKKSLALARENGHLIFINTGRVKANLDKDVLKIDVDGYVCGCGTAIYYNGEELLHNTLDKNLCIKVANLLRDCNIFALFEAAVGLSIDGDMDIPAEGKRILAFFKDMKINSSIDNKDFIFDKFAMWYNETSDIDRFKKEISNNFDYIDRGSHMAEIVPRGFSKASGIEYLCKYFDVPLDSCYAFGDSSNDLSMLQYVPHSVAMGNSTPMLFDIVEYVTTDVEEDGIWNAFKHYGII